MGNARQILGILTAAFDSFSAVLRDQVTCTDTGKLDDVQDLACHWIRIQTQALQLLEPDIKADTDSQEAWVQSISQWVKNAQGMMSSMASNYDMARIVQGQPLAALSCLAAAVLAWRSNRDSLGPLFAVAVPYMAMMFASSYVEEEHQFWYWVSSAWLAHLASRHAQKQKGIIAALPALVATRVLRAWNQTGQKYAGEPDITKTFIVTQPRLLWALVAATHGQTAWALIRRFSCSSNNNNNNNNNNNSNNIGVRVGVRIGVAVAATVLVGVVAGAAFAFKIVFSAEDTPELVVEPLLSLARLMDVHSLIQQARIVFYGLGLLFGAVFLFTHRQDDAMSRGAFSLLLSSSSLLLLR